MRNALSVVVIDDDPDLRSLIQLTLEFTASWQVATAEDGATGIELARKLMPDVVVVDLMMPGMDGYEVCQHLREDEATQGIPLVMLTARKELDEEKLGEVGAAGVVFKPFEPEQLAERISELIGVKDA